MVAMWDFAIVVARRPKALPARGFNTSICSPTSSPAHTSAGAYNNTALLHALDVLHLAIWDATKYDSQNLMLGPALRAPSVYDALVTIQEAVNTTTLPKTGAAPSNGTIPTDVVRHPSSNGDGVGNLSSNGGVVGTPSSNGDVVYLKNQSPEDICFFAEFTSGNFLCPDICNFDRDVIAGRGNGIIVSPYTTRTVFTDANFNGPFNTIVDGVRATIDGTPALMQGVRGARHEINYASYPDGVWYDVDYEFALSTSTLAPTDSRNNTSGLPSMQGETNILAKVNDAWQTLSAIEKAVLVAHSKYIGSEGGISGNLTQLYHDKEAPPEVNFFLQVTAGLQGYVVPGSYPGFERPAGSFEAQMKPVADSFSWHVKGPHNMTIVAY